MKYFSVCSGIEAASVAWEPLGFVPVGFSEIEEFPCSVLKHRYPNVKNYGDLNKYNEWDVGAVDILIGGTPCQSFSVAGMRKGLADPRGNLALTFVGLVDKLRPKWVVWENVPGVLSSNGGRDYASLIGALAELGYGYAWRVLDSQYFGVPQRRRRVFLVATDTGDCRRAAEVLSIGDGLCGNPEESDQEGQSITPDDGTGRQASRINCQPDGISGTVTSKWHKGSGGPAGDEHYNMVVIDRAAFNQGVNAAYEPHIVESSVMDTLVARGPHAVGIPFRKSRRAQNTEDFETWIDDGVSNTLNTFDMGDVRTTHAVVNDMHVRRLTPVECERLQGFPDNWTRIPWREKNENLCPDGHRYKAIGNSMAVPVVQWIGRRILGSVA